MAYGLPGNAFLPPPTPGQMYAPMQVPKAVRRIGEQAFWSTHQYNPAQQLANSEFRLFAAPQGHNDHTVVKKNCSKNRANFYQD